MSENKETRAAKMAAQYGDKLAELEKTKPKIRAIKQSDLQTPEQKERLLKAKEKLRDFIDLIKQWASNENRSNKGSLSGDRQQRVVTGREGIQKSEAQQRVGADQNNRGISEADERAIESIFKIEKL